MRVITISETFRTDGHVTLQVRGFGTPGQRPLLGTVVCTPDEATYLAEALVAEFRRQFADADVSVVDS